MKRFTSLFLAFLVILLSLNSCHNIEKQYTDKAIRVKVSHIGGFEVYDEYDLYFDTIREGEKYELPSGEANPSYKVDITITDITEEGVAIVFSQPMDRIMDGDPQKWILEQTTFMLKQEDSQRFTTPTDGGGDVFEFSIIHKEDIPSIK